MRKMKFGTIVLILGLASLATAGFGDESLKAQIKEDAHTVKGDVKAGGRKFKEAFKATGHAFRDSARGIKHAVKGEKHRIGKKLEDKPVDKSGDKTEPK